MDDEEDLLIQKGNEDFEGESEKRSIFASLLGFLEFGTVGYI